LFETRMRAASTQTATVPSLVLLALLGGRAESTDYLPGIPLIYQVKVK
jgi:hypothetical protein